MNNTELDQLLKSAPVPERPAEYWEGFPEQILAASARGSSRPSRSGARPFRRTVIARLALVTSVVTACLVLGYAFRSWRFRSPGLTGDELAAMCICLREVQALFPDQVKAVVFDAIGPRLELSDYADVCAAQPVFVRVTGPGGTRDFLTFSGQQIRLNGETLAVLVDARGYVLLVGRRLAWTSSDASAKAGEYRFAARLLGTTS